MKIWYTFYLWLLYWMCNWGKVMDGLIGVLSFNLLRGRISFWWAKKIARFAYRTLNSNKPDI